MPAVLASFQSKSAQTSGRCGLQGTAIHCGNVNRAVLLNSRSVTSSPSISNRWIVPASRDKGAAVDRSERSKPGEYIHKFEDKWNARILPDDDYDDEYEGKREEKEDPAKLLMAREKFLGRIVLISLGAILLSERLSGKGMVTALNMATGVPVFEIEPALGILVGGLLAAGFSPVLIRALARAKARAEGREPEAKWTNVDSFQVTTGRLACMVLAGMILAEATTGKGILALLNIETGVEITEIEAGLTFILLLLVTEDMK